MCDHIVMLARLNQRRWVSCCEHGSTHLTWDSVSVRLPLSRLSAMSRALNECAQTARRFRIASAGEICVVFDQFNLYQVWFGGVGLCLAIGEFELFRQLIVEAGEHSLAFGCNEMDIPLATPICTTYHLFSVN